MTYKKPHGRVVVSAEVCAIRIDRWAPRRALQASVARVEAASAPPPFIRHAVAPLLAIAPVSYTHLTLPTKA